MNQTCKRLEFLDKCPYIKLNGDCNMNTYCGEIIDRSPTYSCIAVPCHYAIEVLLKKLVNNKE